MALIVREYVAADGKTPFREWLDSLPVVARARIQARVLRFELGNLGDHKSVGSGVWEARVMFSIIVLLVGGDKGAQAKDISRAQGFWGDYMEAKRHGTAK
jgi:putative component of toxin-antitoxin plasmid stabilization module